MPSEILNGRLVLPHTDGPFPLGTDAVLLGDFARPPRGAAVCDLCAGSGAVGLLLLARDPSLTVTALELQPRSCALMEQAVRENGIAHSFHPIQGDLRRVRELLPAGRFSHVVCNPPYYPVGQGFAPEQQEQAVAKTELCCTLEEVCAAASWLLRTGGCLWMVHLPQRLTDLLCSLRAGGLEPKLLRTVCPKPNAAPSLLLLKAVRGGKPGLRWEAPLRLANADGSPTQEYRRIYHMD